MSSSLHRIRQLFKTLVLRERGILLLRTVLQLGALLWLLVLVATIFSWVNWDRSAGWLVLTLLAGCGGWFAFVLPFRREWRGTGDLINQARRVESEYPVFAGCLITVSERLDGPVGHESPALFDRIARRTEEHIKTLRPAHVHSLGPVWRRLGLWLSSGLFAVLLFFLNPGGPWGVFAWGLGWDTSAAAMEVVPNEESAELARVGDLVIRYFYPEYTGLESRVVPNSTGEVHGPPGTRVIVQLKSAQNVERAALFAYEAPGVEAQVQGGRSVTSEFHIQAEAGTYHFEFMAGGTTSSSAKFPVQADPDLAPEITLDKAGTVLEIAVDEPLGLGWMAKDDFGISRVKLEINEESARSLASPRDRQAELEGTLGMRPAELGLRPGNRVEMVVAAWDNDEWSGAKVGRSRPVTVVILGARGTEMISNSRRIEIRDLLVDLLAEHLLDAWPPGVSGKAYASWGQGVAEQYQPLQDLITQHPSILRSQLAGNLVSSVMEKGMEVVRFTQVSFDPFQDRPAAQGSVDTVAGLRAVAIEEVEHAIIVLDKLIQQVALKEMVERADDMKTHADKLAAMADADAERLPMASEIDRLDRSLESLRNNIADLSRGSGLHEFARQRSSELQALFGEMRGAQEQGEEEEADKLIGRTSREVTEFKEELTYRMESQEQKEDQLGEELKKFMKELASLERNQRQLLEKVRSNREEDNAESADAVQNLWKRLDKKMAQASKDAKRYQDGLKAADRLFYEQERAKSGEAELQRLSRAIEARDPRKALEDVGDASNAWEMVKRTAELERQRGRGRAGPQSGQAQQIIQRIDEVNELLRQLYDAAREISPELAAKTRSYEQEQEKLSQRTSAARQKAAELAQQMPIQPRGLMPAMKGADEQMEHARSALENSLPMPAEGAQGQAADRLKEAQEAIKQAMQDMARMARARAGSGNPSSGKSSGSGEEPEMSAQDIEIPSPEDFRTPEEYRRSLLEGMQGDVPEEFRGMKKRYYEGLVKQ